MLLKIVADDEVIIKPEDIHYYGERPAGIAAAKYEPIKALTKVVNALAARYSIVPSLYSTGLLSSDVSVTWRKIEHLTERNHGHPAAPCRSSSLIKPSVLDRLRSFVALIPRSDAEPQLISLSSRHPFYSLEMSDIMVYTRMPLPIGSGANCEPSSDRVVAGANCEWVRD